MLTVKIQNDSLERIIKDIVSDEEKGIVESERLTPDNCDNKGYPLRTAMFCKVCDIEQMFWFYAHQMKDGEIYGSYYNCSECSDTILWRKK